MPINTAEALSLVTQICEEEKLRVAVKESVKGGFIAGGATILGGLFGGPIGLAIGGTLGGCTAAYLSQGKFKSVVSIINNDLTGAQRESLANSVRMFLQNRSVEDLAAASNLLLSPSAKMVLLQVIIQFVISALGVIFQWQKNRRSRGQDHGEPPLSPSSSRV
ncbi:protein Nazo-like isoform X1 [Palaemon carinicauda]|uniref:protein Nazo-like isoform X1 n=1 Tax=Palaemon carinicauda TaxID=392227 RepID=UPI0035B6A89E